MGQTPAQETHPPSIPEEAEQREPVALFTEWFEEAEAAGLALPESVALATAAENGVPSVRMVLLKEVDERGFVFFTNYESRKAREVEENPVAALCFHWAALERQVRVTGTVSRIGEAESDEYFQSRGRGSRLGAWASRQSRSLPGRNELEGRLAEVTARFNDGEVPLPPFWGGYRIEPNVIEFWQGRPDRLHDRLVFERADDGWSTRRLYP